jgi:uncharacterized protein (DUF1800 family)
VIEVRKLLVIAGIMVSTLGSTASVSASDRSVERAQRILTLSGFEPGPVDGLWGRRTASALTEIAAEADLLVAPASVRELRPSVFAAMWQVYHQRTEAAEAAQPHLQTIVDVADARHLLERAGIGAHPSEITELVGVTRSQAITHVLNGIYGRRTSSEPPAFLSSPFVPHYWIRWDYEEEDRQAFRIARDQEMGELRNWWVREMIATPNPQAERLILLWHNHFVTAYSGVQQEVHAVARQHWTFRELGHGSFRDLTKAMVRDPAILNYLDNNRSRKEQPNENLARELMELFVLGEGNYTEATVKAVARALTGYSYNEMRNFEFEFNPWDHDRGTKTVLGQRGRFDGDDIVGVLLDQPAAAEFVSRRFWNVYISDFNVDEAHLQKIASAFRDSDYEIPVLLRAVLTSQAFWAPENRATIVKSPVDLLVGGIRSTGVLPEWWAALPNWMASLGQNLFEAPNVAGWPGGPDWVTPSRMLMRSEMLSDLATAEPLEAEQDPAMVMEEMMGEMAGDKPMMALSDDLVGRSVFIRYAAEDFEGPPKFRISAATTDNDRSKIAWSSQPQIAEGGIDTARFGRVETSDLPWRIAKVDFPEDIDPVEMIVYFQNDHCCGPGGSDGGDRNFFVDWVALDGRLYPAAEGKQISNCSNSQENPGGMYCSGRLEMTEFIELLGPESGQIAASQPGQGLQVDRVAFDWGNSYDPNSDWQSLNFAMLKPRLGSIGVDAIRIRIIRNRSDQGIRTLLQFEDRSCYPTCLGGLLPRAAYTNDDPGSRHINLVLSGPEWNDEISQWNQLTDAQRAFVSAIWMAVPEILEHSKKGRNWRERIADAQLGGWEQVLEHIVHTLPKSRYARYAPDEGLQIVPSATGGSMMMSMMSSLTNTSPDQIAGVFRDQAHWTKWEELTGTVPPAQIFLASAPVSSSATTSDLDDLFLDPIFNLK